jgi:nucleotide-binding universal stress UspA family protein
MTKMLIGIDDSLSAMQAVEYVARHFGNNKDIQVGLVHVLPNLPAIFWDEGHILSDAEKQDRKRVVDRWLVAQQAKMEPFFKKARDMLVAGGITGSRVDSKFISDSTDAGHSILEEARDNGYRAVVVGRSHHSPKHALGATAAGIASHGTGMVVMIVE